jgi:hypothetical protein
MIERTRIEPSVLRFARALLALVLLFVGPVFALESQDLKVVRDATRIGILRGDQPILRYRYGNVPYKPYLEELFTPSGINILRDAPHDHLHHHGLMFAVSVDGVNFWEEHQAPGKQKHISFGVVETHNENEPRSAVIEDRLDWIDPRTEELLIKEIRTLTLRRSADLDATLLTWTSHFALPAAKEKATLSGSRYFGLGMRFPVSMDKGGKFFNADGAVGVEGTNDKVSDWCAYSANADGKPVTVAVFDSPDNPRHPAVWFTLDDAFAYLSATLALDDRPLEIERDLNLSYGVAVWDGGATAEEIQRLYDLWKGHARI